VTAVRITTADAGYTLPVVTAGEKVLSNSLDPFEAKLTECIGILLIIPAAEIGEMTLENLMESVSSPRKVFGLLLFQYGSILYPHIEYYCENGTDASENIDIFLAFLLKTAFPLNETFSLRDGLHSNRKMIEYRA
jgi:hypothetical protein